MKADATAEKRPACSFVSEMHGVLTAATHEYEGGVEVIVILLVKVLVVFVRLLPELFVETRSRVWVLFRESSFDGGSQVIAKPVYNAKFKK